ncbi:MAG TPA: dUTP diphosphatase [Clostridiales bacterium]|nr:dUTP diphosphatase [Clostridiales bacterium]
MNMFIDIKVKMIKKDFKYDFSIPKYATPGSAGLDLHACLEKPVTVKPGQICKIPTGIAIQIKNKEVAGFIFPRSGLASNYGISLVNSVGVIDSDYTGELICPIINYGKDDYTINPGDRIAQIVFLPVYTARFIMTDELDETVRGSGGFGSTGK